MAPQHKKRRPWNSIAEQVYSIASKNEHGVLNYNIATYISPVTMKPKRYAIALYKQTQTYHNCITLHSPFLLQALSTEHIGLVSVLGKKSGATYNKHAYITKKNPAYARHSHTGLSYFLNSVFVLECIPEQYIPCGDHDIVIARIAHVIIHNHDLIPLTTKDLQAHRIIG